MRGPISINTADWSARCQDGRLGDCKFPDCAPLHPGYACYACLILERFSKSLAATTTVGYTDSNLVFRVFRIDFNQY